MGIEVPEDDIRRTALDWTIRVQDANFAEWDLLTNWLSADPRHAECFDTLSVRDAEVAELLLQRNRQSRPAQSDLLQIKVTGLDTDRSGFRKHRGDPEASHGWMRLAAGLAIPVALSAGWFLHHRIGKTMMPSPVIEVATGPAEQRAVTLADGTYILVAGASRLSIDATERSANLLSGRATFRVVHDAARPFRVRLGSVVVTDVGTVFDLHRTKQGSEIAVAEGTVQLDGTAKGQRVHAGQIVRLSGGEVVQTSSISPADVGGWKDGRYDYADTSIAEIAADLTVATGVTVRAGPEVADRRFGGSIQVKGSPEHAIHAIAPLLGTSVRKDGSGWELGKAANADRP
jgi:transmembrane sensor